MQSRLLDKIKTKMWIKRDEIYGKTPEFPMGKMTVFPTRKLKIALSLNRGIGQVTYLRNIVDRYPVYSWLTVLSCLRDYRREK